MAAVAAANIPLPLQQPAAPVAGPQVGHLNEREVSLLRSACRDKDEENGAVIARILCIASLVAGIFAAMVVPGATGLVAGIAVYFVLGNLVSQTYHGLRNHAYLEAGEALYMRGFKEYIAAQNVNPTIDNITTIHAAYKKFAVAQALQLHQAAVAG